MEGSVVQPHALETNQKPWPAGGLTRVPYRVFQKDETYESEQERIFQGPLWHYLCMEIEIANGGVNGPIVDY